MAVNRYELGQCWMSEAEPEMGLGFVRVQDPQVVTIEFPISGELRRYGKRTAPLRRVEFRAGEAVRSASGDRLTIERVETRGGLIWYIGEGRELCETELSPQLKLQRPLQRFLSGQWDPLPAYRLRQETLALWHRSLRSPARGLIGPRASLLPHQLYVVDQISRRALPRALLADEVGLGKTIEAGWILHRLWVSGRVRRVLVVVPGALVNQWFVELFRRFNAPFWVPDSQSEVGEGESLTRDDLLSQERVILSLESWQALEAAGVMSDVPWDMVVIDEAHRLPAGEGFHAAERLAAATPGLLLLTATPEQLGLEGHFLRLRLIDPSRFTSFEAFEKEYGRYRQVAKKAEDERLDRAQMLALVDEHGTGRVYFRNSRRVVELEHAFFPRRELHAHRLEGKFPHWLGEFGKENRAVKTLVICADAARAVALEKAMREDYGLKAVAFHEELPLLARDRNAAYFEDPQGAVMLICSEIGGEGRNFQHASNLVFADLPTDPDVLEQRIGRLDRIGQASDIRLHVPYEPGTREEFLVRWHQEVFHAFDAPTKGAGAVQERYSERLHAVLAEVAEATTKKALAQASKTLDGLIQEAGRDYARTLAEIEAGRDRLIELNSFDPEEGIRLNKLISDEERPVELRAYVEQLFDVMGVHSDDLDSESVFAEPGDTMYASYFPGLPVEGMRMTFSREKALLRDDLTLMSWDHPMVTGTMEAISSQELGNSALATWIGAQSGGAEDRPRLLIEAQFVLEPAPVNSAWNAGEFLAPEPIRVVVDGTGADVTAKWPAERVAASIRAMPPDGTSMVRKIPSDGLRSVLGKALKRAEVDADRRKKIARESMELAISEETRRLRVLQKRSKLVSEREVDWWDDRAKQVGKSLDGARVRLDSLLLVLGI